MKINHIAGNIINPNKVVRITQPVLVFHINNNNHKTINHQIIVKIIITPISSGNDLIFSSIFPNIVSDEPKYSQ